MEMNKRKLGAKAEQTIKDYLEKQGIFVLEMNYRCRQGEVDVIALDGSYYVFIEVKYRNSLRYGLPQEAVDRKKQHRISQTALYYLYSHSLSEDTPVRFDVAAVLGEQIHYIRDAFRFCG